MFYRYLLVRYQSQILTASAKCIITIIFQVKNTSLKILAIKRIAEVWLLLLKQNL